MRRIVAEHNHGKLTNLCWHRRSAPGAWRRAIAGRIDAPIVEETASLGAGYRLSTGPARKLSEDALGVCFNSLRLNPQRLRNATPPKPSARTVWKLNLEIGSSIA